MNQVRISLSLLLLCCVFFSASAQTAQQIDSILAASDTAMITQLALEYDSTWTKDHGDALLLAATNSYDTNATVLDTTYWEIQWITADSIPQYHTTTNLTAARSISTDRVRAGGSAGLSLDGSGIRLGEWDGGAVLTTHPEYSGRVVAGDGVSQVNFHATHVAGTMIASGVDANAIGMAPAANITFYSFNNDVTEMANEANNGIILSNHSYGFIRGWTFGNFGAGQGFYWFGSPGISATEDFRFGFYSTPARQWDQIANSAPFYLIVKSAGNDRNEGPQPGAQHFVIPAGGSDFVSSTATRDRDGGNGGFDCIGDKGVAKNVLTVGAVADIPGGYNSPASVVMSSFSSFGPADDGRIKPDIVANGIGLRSTWDGSNSSGCNGQQYCSISGTSMSSPSVTGSCALLQQHYSNTHNSQLMRSSTLKGLIIHTADEAGTSIGPDYRFGWGLMNTATAASIITQDQTDDEIIQEATLNNGGTFSFDFNYDGSGDPFMRATLAWNDPAGTPPPNSLDPITPMLVNDLDLRITRLSDNTTFLPWRLNVANPSAAATTADNSVDNVEQVFIGAPQGGDYRITVTHKGALQGGSQVFSLIVSGFDGISGQEELTQQPAPKVKVFPHPVQSTSLLEIVLPVDWHTASLVLTDVLGRSLATQSLHSGTNYIDLQASEYPDGVYFYQIHHKGSIAKTGRFQVNAR